MFWKKKTSIPENKPRVPKRKPRYIEHDGEFLHYLPVTLQDLKLMQDAKGEIDALDSLTRSIACDSDGVLLYGPDDVIEMSIDMQASIIRAAGNAAAEAMEAMANPLFGMPSDTQTDEE